MEQTDRLTDKPATHWKSAIYDEKDPSKDGYPFKDQWLALDSPPMGFIVYRKKEICPDTGRPHFQVHVDCGRQVRWTALKNWIKYTKWMPVFGKDHIRNSINYISKEATTAPGAKTEIVRGEQYLQLHELLMEVARTAEFPYGQQVRTTLVDDITVEQMLEADFNNRMVKEQYTWRMASRALIRKDIRWISKLSNPILSTLWSDYHIILLEKVAEERIGGGALSLSPPGLDSSE